MKATLAPTIELASLKFVHLRFVTSLSATMVSAAVIGAGVVGLATARTLARKGLEVTVLERSASIGNSTSARNSGVIHGGMYYLPGSLKAELCVKGRRMLYDFCDEFSVSYKRRGKLIVATSDEERQTLSDILQRSRENGLDEAHGDALRMISAEQALELEPNLQCKGALLSPSTGVLDVHEFMLALQGDAEAQGAMIAFNTEVKRISRNGEASLFLETSDEASFEFDSIINCGGLTSVDLARTCPTSGGRLPENKFAKGNYFKLEGCKTPFERLIYPVPEKSGLGVHITIDVGGQARFGPDVEWLDIDRAEDIDYSVESARSEKFYGQVRRYWPDLPDGALVPDYSGVRPKVAFESEIFNDFTIMGPRDHGLSRLIHCFGIESPGLTSSLAIAEKVSSEL